MQALRRAFPSEKLGLYVVIFLANLGWGVMPPILSTIQAEFDITLTQVALANSAFGVSRLLLDVPIGALMNRVDQRLLGFLGALMISAGSLLCAIAADFNTLLVGRLLNGAGAAIIQVAGLVWISQMSTARPPRS